LAGHPRFSSIVAATGHAGLIRDPRPSAVLSGLSAGRPTPLVPQGWGELAIRCSQLTRHRLGGHLPAAAPTPFVSLYALVVLQCWLINMATDGSLLFPAYDVRHFQPRRLLLNR
jgi:hypothetical protein